VCAGGPGSPGLLPAETSLTLDWGVGGSTLGCKEKKVNVTKNPLFVIFYYFLLSNQRYFRRLISEIETLAVGTKPRTLHCQQSQGHYTANHLGENGKRMKKSRKKTQ